MTETFWLEVQQQQINILEDKWKVIECNMFQKSSLITPVADPAKWFGGGQAPKIVKKSPDRGIFKDFCMQYK